MKTLGIVLLIVGILALVYGGINYSRDRTVFEVGSLSVTATEHKNFPFPAVLGAIVLIGGAGLLVVGARRAVPR
jgi:uncharacterized membrane protein YidH (DUF202 family)